MANRTDPTAIQVHGTNPQFLIEKIMRNRIYSSNYWKEHCFALTAETMVDKALDLKYFGGMFGGNKKPTPFICLILKMLQIQPEKEIIKEFINNEDYKYVKVLGAFYLRLVGKPAEIYETLEDSYRDFRKIRYRGDNGLVVTHVDEFIDDLLTKDFACDVSLPFIPKRHILEFQGVLKPRVSILAEELEGSDSDSDNAKEESSYTNRREENNEKEKKKQDENNKQENDRRRDSNTRDNKRDDYRKEDRRDDRKDRHRDDYRRDDRRDDRKDDRRVDDRRDRYRDDYRRDDRRDDRKDNRRDDRRDDREYRDRDRHRDDRRDDRREDSRRDDRKRRDKDDDNRDSKKSKGDERGSKDKPKTPEEEIEEMNKLRESLGLKPLSVKKN